MTGRAAGAFTVVAHADWSGARVGAVPKRQIALALRDAKGWRLDPPEPVSDPARLPARLVAAARGGAALLALDVPIGLPRAFAAAHLSPYQDFVAWLDALDTASSFLAPARTLDEVSPARPFFPAARAAGAGLKRRFLSRLGLDEETHLRACDRAGRTANGGRIPRACGLFWTLGGNQVGKAAASAWAELLKPARAAGLRIWPFEGSLAHLAGPGALVAAEAYPGEGYARLGFALPSNKRSQAWRAAQAPAIEAWAKRCDVTLAPDLAGLAAAGFGPSAEGEDAFDATVGALAALAVATGLDPEGTPDEAVITQWEGWMLGRIDRP